MVKSDNRKRGMAIINSLVWLGEAELPRSIAIIKEELTVVPRKRFTRAKEVDEDTGELEWVTREEESKGPVFCYKEDEENGLLGVPIDWAFNNLEDEILDQMDDHTIRGEKIEVFKLPNPNHSSAPDGQAEFFNEVNERTRFFYSGLAEAPTGSGKTVAVLNSIGHAKRTALVIVPNITLADQWMTEVENHLGIDRSSVGIVGDGKCRWKGCPIVVAVINSVVMSDLGQEFYDNFGFVAWDESHRLGAHEFSKSMFLFAARFKLAVTATPNRKDGMDALVFHYFGKPSVVASSEALPTTCWVIQNRLIGNLEWMQRCRSDAKPMKWLSNLEGRNKIIIDLAVALYRKGRHIIIFSRFIEHLEYLKAELIKAGLPEKELGQYTRTQGKKKTRVGKGYLDKVKDNSRIILATYAMGKDGFDCPRLDAGIEATPVADNKQGIGRVRRPKAKKKSPIWFTFDDLNVGLFEGYTSARLRGFKETNVTIKKLSGTKI